MNAIQTHIRLTFCVSVRGCVLSLT